MAEQDAPPLDSGELKTTSSPSGLAPARIGNYRILEKIGEGGMGEVYEAEQERPVRRRVALKLIKWGMDTQQVVARFETERQALAIMSHPGIAKVLDAGATDVGRPYFVMEWVPGLPITDYCDKHRLAVRERLELFVGVCQAIQHAHQKGVIHRDIKPTNVLVLEQEGKPIAKMIDFGVAKAIGQRLTEKTLYTQRGVLVGTPGYASPEQVELTAEDVDTRTDIYSLGVLLYELLVGVPPIDPLLLRVAGVSEMLRIIREDEPEKPSTRITSLGQHAERIARLRGVDTAALRREVRDDLDWIVMKALEKDRSRRYQSASELAVDVQRHFTHQPVLASPPSVAYRLAKFHRRHRAATTSIAGLLLALAVGLVGTTFGLWRAVRAERRATTEAATAAQVSDFLVGLFEVSDPRQSQGEAITARELLEQGTAKIERDLTNQPVVQARLLDTIGRVYHSLGSYGEARPLLEDALRIRRRTLGEDDPEVADTLTHLAGVLADQGDYGDARSLYEQSLAICERQLGPEHPRVASILDDFAALLFRTGEYDQATPLLERALAIVERSYGPDDPRIANSLNSLAAVHYGRTEYDEAKQLWERALRIREASLPAEHPLLAASLNNLATVLQTMGDNAGARPLLERSTAIQEKVLGPDHPDLAAGLSNLATTLRGLGEFDEAKRLYHRAIDIQERAAGPDHPEVARFLYNLGWLLVLAEDRGAQEFCERSLAIRQRALGPDHPDVARSLFIVGRALQENGDHRAARDHFARSLAVWERSGAAQNLEIAWTLNNLAFSSSVIGDTNTARTAYEKALAIFERLLGPDHPDLTWVLVNLGELRMREGRYEEAETLLQRSRRLREDADVLWRLARLDLARGRIREAHAWLSQAVAGLKSQFGEDHFEFAYGEACRNALIGERDQAIAALERSLEMGLPPQRIFADPDLDSLRGDPEFEVILRRERDRMATPSAG